MRAYRRSSPGTSSLLQRLLLLLCMAALVATGIVFWLALLNAGRSAVAAVGGVGQWFLPVQATAIPRQGAVFKRSPLEIVPPPAPTQSSQLQVANATRPAQPSATATATADPATPTVEPSATAEPSATPAAAATAAATPTVPPPPATEPPAPTSPPAPTAVADVPTAAPRPPRLSLPHPDSGAVVSSGPLTVSVRVRADADLAVAKGALDGAAQAVTLVRLDDGVWQARFDAGASAGTHKVWFRVRDASGAEGSVAWSFEAR